MTVQKLEEERDDLRRQVDAYRERVNRLEALLAGIHDLSRRETCPAPDEDDDW